MKPLIYVVEDDLNIQNVLKIALENSQFEIILFEHANALFRQLQIKTPDLFILDIMLPDINGLEIIKRLKKSNNYQQTPILVVSAKSSELDRVIGLDIGADDYLVKPFGVLELVSRVKALLRRTVKQDDNHILTIGDLLLDTKKHLLAYKENNLQLTNKQSQLLKYLISQQGNVLSREEIMNTVWGYDFLGETRTLDVHIRELRKKLFQLTNQKDIIETIHGTGYKFEL
ncbi:MAG: response regulator transcription factor [Tenericutes bacterium]|jgi:two-component system alkaline phosphatase synthesis response regulator PhoP|nr:response regulator transcription factor [Mycoplasmatota bacterium]